MPTDAFAKNTLAPLVLRLALAAVFIYHGADKIFSRGNDWGAAWATHMQAQQAKLPLSVKEKFNAAATREGRTDADRDQLRFAQTEVERAYSESGMKAPEAMQYHAAQLAVAWGEFLGGIALLLGFLSRLAALGLVVIQVGAIMTVTWTQGFSVTQGGFEYNVVLIAVCLAMICLGSGPFSLSGLLKTQRRAKAPPPAKPQEPVKV
jgi:uncharacterized membrane protein YphA (DoxX/SURF4 family)